MEYEYRKPETECDYKKLNIKHELKSPLSNMTDIDLGTRQISKL